MGHLRKHLLVRHNNIKKARPYKKYNKNDTHDLNTYSTSDESESTTLDDSDSEDTPIIDDNEYDLENEKKAEILFRKLFQSAQKLENMKSSRRYTGNSVRTRQRKLRKNKLAAVGSHKITQFFNSTNNINLNDNEEIEDQLDYESEQQLQETIERIQKIIDNANILKLDKARTCLERNELLPSQCGKHPSKSFLHDKNVSLRVASYLRSTKFKVTPSLLKKFFETKILPELHIDQAQTISLRLWRDGLLVNCEECKTNKQDPSIIDCCACCIVANQPNFLAEHGLIQQKIEKCGHKLNYIEMYWRAAKKRTRETYNYTIKGLKKQVPITLDSIPVEQIR
ncbi:79_t:CDS:2, partial [Cetraspora pellucida]